MLRPAISEFNFRAHCGQEFARGLDVPHLRNIFQNDGLIGEQGSGHRRQRSILGSANTNCSQQRIAAADYEFVHSKIIPVVMKRVMMNS